MFIYIIFSWDKVYIFGYLFVIWKKIKKKCLLLVIVLIKFNLNWYILGVF